MNSEAVARPTISKTPAVKEQIGIRPCLKSQWSVTEAGGEHYDLTVWTATNFNNFPIQIQFGSPATTVEFEDVNFGAPDPALFDPPGGYFKYEGIQDMILKNTEKGQATNSP